jgi:hypothetical protein
MYYNGIYIPDSIAVDMVPSNVPFSGSGGIRPQNLREPATKTAETTAAAPPSSSGTETTILWLGVLTSVAGLAFEMFKYLRERKK